MASQGVARPLVVAPIPFVPPGAPAALRRLRSIPRQVSDEGIEVEHPRVPTGPGYVLHGFEADIAYPFVLRHANRLHEQERFALIHAHFIYPDGVIAARLGRRWGIPVLTTEHAPWLPWLADWPRVRRKVQEALPHIWTVTVVSEALRQTVHEAVGLPVQTDILPNVLDDETFVLRDPKEPPDPDELLFVGAVRRVKGLDVLIRALPLILARKPGVKLTVIGEPFQRAYRRDETEVRELARRLGIEARVSFEGGKTPQEVARAMRRAGAVVVPSRRETFSAVTVEALASGTPVVASRCGGPEELLTSETGRLVPTEDPAALADGVIDVLDHRDRFVGSQLRAHVVPRFGWKAARMRVSALYSKALESGMATPPSSATIVRK